MKLVTSDLSSATLFFSSLSVSQVSQLVQFVQYPRQFPYLVVQFELSSSNLPLNCETLGMFPVGPNTTLPVHPVQDKEWNKPFPVS